MIQKFNNSPFTIQESNKKQLAIHKINNIREFNANFGNKDKIQVLILHKSHSSLAIFLIDIIKKIKQNFISPLIEFYSADLENPRVKIIVDLYRLKLIPTVLFFKKGKLQNKIEGTISKSEFESMLFSIVNELIINENTIN